MRIADVIDEDGVVRAALTETTDRVYPEGRTFSYCLNDGAQRISVTQNDVRAIQLAKAALYAGCRLLMDEFGIDELDRVTLAGAFGAHISPVHALALGMIPDCAVDNVHSAGNAAGTGARIALLNAEKRAEIERVVGRIHKVETAIEPRFQEHFIEAMAIPHKSAPYPKLRSVVQLPEGGGSPGGDAPERRRRRRRRG